MRDVRFTRPLLVTLVLGGCSFDVSTAQMMIDAAPPIDMVDAPPPPVLRWLIASNTEGAMAKVTVIGIRDGKFEAACPAQPVPGSLPLRDLLPHPNLPYVYAVEAGFHGATITCDALTWAGMANVTTTRPIQRIAYDATLGVGFFTGDGPSAVGVYRFTTATDGAPTVTGNADATSNSGALALDAAQSALYVAGPNIASSYALVGAGLDLPVMRTNASTCAGPSDLVVSGESILSFCSDSPDIHKYSRSPFTFESMVTMAAVDRVVTLPGDRAVAASTTPGLIAIALGAGNPTWQAGPTLASRVTALAASTDGELVVSARLVNATTAELALWKVVDSTISMADTTTVPGVVSAVAITMRPQP